MLDVIDLGELRVCESEFFGDILRARIACRNLELVRYLVVYLAKITRVDVVQKDATICFFWPVCRVRCVSMILLFIMALAGSGDALASRVAVLYCQPAVAPDLAAIYRAACAEVLKEIKFQVSSVTMREGVVAAEPDGNVIRLDILKINHRAITGRLAWNGSKNAKAGLILGPVITTSIMDGSLNNRSMRDFARSLVAVSKIQFTKT